MKKYESDMPSIIEATKFRQEQYGYTQLQMAKALGMTQSHYSEFLSGKIRMPLNARIKACKIGIPAKVLLQGE